MPDTHVPLDEKWSPNDLNGEDVKKDFIARCHLEVSAGGFLRFHHIAKRQSWLDERLMAEFLESKLAHLKHTICGEIKYTMQTFVWDADLDEDEFLNLVANRKKLLDATLSVKSLKESE